MSYQVNARVSDDLHDEIIAVSEEIDGTKAEAMRTLMRRGLEIDETKAENERLKNQLAATNRRIDANNELVEYVQEQRETEEYQRKRRQHNVFRRAWWWLAGEPE